MRLERIACPSKARLLEAVDPRNCLVYKISPLQTVEEKSPNMHE
jgi:hypothetical protein